MLPHQTSAVASSAADRSETETKRAPALALLEWRRQARPLQDHHDL
jgi:hypothetical protein